MVTFVQVAYSDPVVCDETWIQPVSTQASVTTVDGANNHIFASIMLTPDPTNINGNRTFVLGGACRGPKGGPVEVDRLARSFAYFQRQVDGYCLWALQLRAERTDLASKIVKAVVLRAPEPDPGPNPEPGPTPDPEPNPEPGPQPGPEPGPGPEPSPTSLSSQQVESLAHYHKQQQQLRYQSATHQRKDIRNRRMRRTRRRLRKNEAQHVQLASADEPDLSHMGVIVAYTTRNAGTVYLESVTNTSLPGCVFLPSDAFVFVRLDHHVGACTSFVRHYIPHPVETPYVDNDVSGAIYLTYVVRPTLNTDLNDEGSTLILNECGNVKPPSYNFLVVVRLDNSFKCDWYYIIDAEGKNPKQYRQILQVNEIQSDYDEMRMVALALTLSFEQSKAVTETDPGPPLRIDLRDCIIDPQIWTATPEQPSVSMMLMLTSDYNEPGTEKTRPRCAWHTLRRAFVTRPQSSSTALDVVWTPSLTGYFHMGTLEVASPVDSCKAIGLESPQTYIAYYELDFDQASDGTEIVIPRCSWIYVLPPEMEAVEIAASDQALVVAGSLSGTVSLGACGTFSSNGLRDAFVARFDSDKIALINNERTPDTITEPVWARTCVSVVQLGGPDDDYTTALAPLTSLSDSTIPPEETVTLGGILGTQALYTSLSPEVSKCVGTVTSRAGQPFIARLRLVTGGGAPSKGKGLPIIAIIAAVISAGALFAASLTAYNWHKRYKLRQEVRQRARAVANAIVSAQTQAAYTALEEANAEQSRVAALPIGAQRRRRIMPDGTVVVENMPLRKQVNPQTMRQIVANESAGSGDHVGVHLTKVAAELPPEAPESRLIAQRYYRRALEPEVGDDHVGDVIRKTRLTTTADGEKFLPSGTTVLIPPLTEDLLMHISASQVEKLIPTSSARSAPAPEASRSPKTSQQHPLQLGMEEHQQASPMGLYSIDDPEPETLDY